MSTDAEDLCNEYARNFSALEMRYKALEQQLQTEKDTVVQHERTIDRLKRDAEKTAEEHNQLRKEIDDAQAFKESYYQAKVHIEHLKGRLESARTGVADREREHQHEVEQLRAQMADLHRRIEVSADVGAVQHLRQQKTELEERAALLAGQLLELRETAGHAQIASNAALRDLGARNTEMEQRCRAMEQEVAQARAQMRRAQEAQTEATLARDRFELERARQAMEVEALKKELTDVRGRLADAQSDAAAMMLQRQAEWDAEREQLQAKLAATSRQLETALQQRVADDERLAAAQKAASSRVAAVREESLAELDAAHQAKAAAVDDASRARWRLKTAEQQLEETRAALQHAEARAAAAEQQREHLHTQLETAVQQDAWMAAERDRAVAQLTAMQRDLEAASALKRAADATSIELERARLQLRYAEVDLGASRKETERVAAQLSNIEQIYHDKMRQLTEDLKATRKHYKVQLQRADESRKKLAHTLAKREAELYQAKKLAGLGLGGAGDFGERGGSAGGAAAVAAAAARVHPTDGVTGALAILRQQSEAAAHLQDTLGKL